MSKRQKSKQMEANESKAIKLLFKAVHKGRVNEVADLIRNGVSVNATTDGYDCGVWTPLHFVAAASRYNPMTTMLECLASAGGDVNAKNENGETPFHQTCENGSIADVLLLLHFAADVNIRGNKGETPLHRAGSNYNVAIARLLVEKGASVNAVANDGCTPLHHAAMCGNIEIVQYLVSVGADVLAKDNDGKTALDLAKEENSSDGYNAEVIEYLASVM